MSSFPVNLDDWNLSFKILGTKSQALSAFSVYSNGMKVLSYKNGNSSDMMCLHGIRAISTQWVVLGHTFMMVPKLPFRNLAQFPQVRLRFYWFECNHCSNYLNLSPFICSPFQFVAQYHNMVILSALVSVDTFFVLSGLLVSITMLKHFEKT